MYSMKISKILQAVAIITVTGVVLASCAPHRHYAAYPPPPVPGGSFSLIINGGPGLAVSRYHDGRYYYRGPQGRIYWRGYDNRYYLDRSYMRREYRSYRDYNDWRNYNNRGNHRGRGRR